MLGLGRESKAALGTPRVLPAPWAQQAEGKAGPVLSIVNSNDEDEFGRWRPYRGNVCSYIEQVIQASQQKGRRVGSGLVSSIPLGRADPTLAPYVIDIPSLTQFRQDTAVRSIEKLALSVLSPKSLSLRLWDFTHVSKTKIVWTFV
ncbi:hypothetical protein WISP_127307 [Willisornis vidua]|uniref:WWE domain-containing protein n=1 Tax=Willisornis vidua TaxID=1566151 RepID=A0ABQ9CWK8_9PASS|nr:hypothetical protein WISP_127307 [Willisornis vidua]